MRRKPPPRTGTKIEQIRRLFHAGRKPREIAAQLGIPASTVQTWLYGAGLIPNRAGRWRLPPAKIPEPGQVPQISDAVKLAIERQERDGPLSPELEREADATIAAATEQLRQRYQQHGTPHER